MTLSGKTLHFEAQEAPYGTWKSPITADLIVADMIRFMGAFEVNGNLYWGELRPSEKGRLALVRKGADGQIEDILPKEFNVRTRVYEYGGVSYLIVGDTVYFSHFADQQIYRRDPTGEVIQLTKEKSGRFADGSYDAKRGLIYYVFEEHGKSVDHSIAAIDVRTGHVKKVAEGFDFYNYPRVSPDGKFLSYVAWNHPNMPWDGSELYVAEILEDGSLGNARFIAGGKNESIYQPSWGPDGRLYFVSDRTGWWNFYREGDEKPLCEKEAEFGFPQWIFGGGGYGFWKDQIVAIFSQNGYDRLGLISLKDGSLKEIDLPYTYFHTLTVHGDKATFVAGLPDASNQLVQYSLKTGRAEVIKKAQNLSIPTDSVSIAKPIEFPTENGLKAHAFYYEPKNGAYIGKKGEFPPLVVISHGGPTGQTYATFKPEIQYWTSRGIAVVDVNYGGSSGYGRAYRDRLKGNWGVVDVDDCIHAALYCVKKGLADRDRLAIMGGSAGGFTTLAALTFRDVFKVGASQFGVSDLEALNMESHKFESHYNEQLIGPYPEAKDLYWARSPIHHADQIKVPILFLQGDEDKIVPPPQSEKMYKSLLKRGVPTAYLLFEKEQHGFRQAANIKRSIEATAYFFSKILGFKLADKIEPVKIENFHE